MEEVCAKAVDWAALNGMLVRSKDSKFALSHIPFALFPSPFPEKLYNLAVNLQPIINRLVDTISQDEKFITDVLKETLLKDEDYRKLCDTTLLKSTVPRGVSLEVVPESIAAAWMAYKSNKSIVLFVVQPNEGNIYDQRWIEKGLWESHGIRVRRATLAEIRENASLSGSDRRLFFGDEEVAVAYFRAGYAPTDYTSEKEWDARLLIERSFAIKCPTIAYHLVGSKKIQQVLAQPGVLEKFISDSDEIALIRSSFTGLYPLDDTEAGKLAVKNAIENPHKYVMKPQREGGGNNIYGEDVKTHLLKLSAEERMAFILMDLIEAPTSKSVMVRNGEFSTRETISELGIYGVWLRVMLNKSAGYLLRTKSADSNEGGVAAGFAVVDSVYLKFLVIGGCGFLGRVIVDQLLNAGSDVRVFDLRKTFEDARVDFVQGDITKLEDVRKAMDGVSTVIHTASPPHGKNKNAYFQVNVVGTKNVIEACRITGVRRLVYTSSASVIYNGQDLVDADESLPYCEVHMDAYNETKAIAEDLVLKANEGPLRTIAIRPSGIFGPRDMQGASTIIDACLKGKNKVQIGLNKTLFDWTYVDNVAHAHLLAARKLKESEKVGGEVRALAGAILVFIITNDQPVFFWDFVKLLWSYLGYQNTLNFALPLAVAFTLAWITEMFAFLIQPFVSLHPTFTVFRIKIFANNRYFDISKAKTLLQYKPIVSLEEGISRTVAYFQAERKGI
ncbi:hypothetical protein HDU67_001128 [Dinochytrium kinnereticum]|nr:hypothetical protein HDU67_001128 [Dinochytrium kinnereticum]